MKNKHCDLLRECVGWVSGNTSRKYLFFSHFLLIKIILDAWSIHIQITVCDFAPLEPP